MWFQDLPYARARRTASRKRASSALTVSAAVATSPQAYPAALPPTLSIMANHDLYAQACTKGARRRAGVSDEYLLQALEGLQNAGDPAYMFAYWRWCSPKAPLSWRHAKMLAEARQARIRAARTSVLFAALAAESYVNEFLSAHGALQQWDREPTHRKYLKATTAACGSQLFFADLEPYPAIVDLFKLRDRLVHPKPGLGLAGAPGESDAEFMRVFAMRRLAEYIVMVGYGAELLMRMTYTFDIVEMTGTVAWRGQRAILRYAKRHEQLPVWNERSERPLFNQARDCALNLNRSNTGSRVLTTLPLYPASSSDNGALRIVA
jgi:hypothetical protein